MPTFKFYGKKAEKLSDNLLQLRSVQPMVQSQEYVASSTRSADTDSAETIVTNDDDIIVMQMSDDVEWHYRADDFEQFLNEQALVKRGQIEKTPTVPLFFSSQSNTRGLENIVKTKALKVITGMVAKSAAQMLVQKMESGLDVGLHTLSDKFEFIDFNKKDNFKAKPYLLFIHGTNSNTNGAFGELKTNNVYSKLFEFYDGRVLAFEHKTLSESPLTNLTNLLNALPDEITLDVISHSRGGIIADLLARCSNGQMPFNLDELKIIDANNDFKNLQPEALVANAAAAGKKIILTKMVRVASPAAGTVLIASRLDNLVNVFCNLLKLIPGAATCMPFTLFLDFAKAVVHERTDIAVFPGVAAQIPGSPLIRLLNNPNRTIDSQLFVISGDVERSGILKTLLVLSTNLYFGEAHDLVVNSNSMFKGTYRTSNVMEHFEQDPSVNHFNYFKNANSQLALLAALIAPEKINQYYNALGETSQIKTVHQRGVTGNKPVVYILPGILGSNLSVGNKSDTLWLNYIKIVGGVLANLNINAADIDASSIHEPTYGALVNYLSTDFDVIPFPYDWRKGLLEAGDLLAAAVETELNREDRTNKEFHFIAHSMGGLVFRAMMLSKPDLWNKITQSKKTKVLMLGVPNEGSLATIRILLGKDSIIKKLALLDFVHTKQQLLDIFKEYPGLAQLLPTNLEGIFGQALWNELKNSNSEYTAIPAEQTLQKGADFYEAIKNTDYDNNIFRYIAGQDDTTPESFSIIKNQIVFTGTSEGDGRVLWSTIPSALLAENIYYVAADHGSIPKLEKAFDGFKELLQKGKTDMASLSKTKPVARGGNAVQILNDTDFVTIPSEAELNESLLGVKEAQPKQRNKETINVRIINGDLVHSNYPVVVGHFKGDGIVNAEKYLDRALDFKLSEYHLVNNYPGDIGTHLVIIDRPSIKENMLCKGGVVVGLGEFGSLTENRLLVTLTQAFLTLAIKFNEYLKNLPIEADESIDFGISSLLIGSEFGGLRITTSVKTIFLAVVLANEKLAAMSVNEVLPLNYKKINKVELVEIYQHKTIQIARALKSLMLEDGFNNFTFTPPDIKTGSGALKIIEDENQQDNWHRIEISVYESECPKTDNGSGVLPIRFISITDKAHADENLIPANRLIVEALIQKMSRFSQWNKAFSQTLYELLIPNSFKGYGSSLNNLVLILDEQTARYPWELLQDANGISEKPMVLNTGIVRQLKTGKQRENIIINTSNRALVIGNPFTDGKYPSLIAAEVEANNVLKILQANGLDTTASIGEEDIDIVQKLLPQSYKIIHIASHGIVGETANEPTGVIIGKQIVFTAGDFDQIRIVPEFVFINCCSSNQYSLSVASQMHQKYNLAASVGTQLIEMGVKAAIVTGWEIDDTAAQLFSATFYEAMFDGKPFGDAIRAARQKTYDNHGQTNTWGAYQCYGDPFYTLKNRSWTKETTYNFVDPVEAINELDNLISEVTSASTRSGSNITKIKIEKIVNALQPSWKLDGRIIERLAEVYKTIKMFEEAISYYEQLFTLENACYTIKTVEQYYNILIRYCIAQLKANKITKKEAQKTITNAFDGLKKLSGETVERYNLIAGTYRRLYEIERPAVKSLVNTANYYRKAYEYSKKAFGTIDFYPYFNWLHFAILLSPTNNDDFLQIPANRNELDAEALNNAAIQDLSAPDFYKKTASASASLALLLSAVDSAAITRYSTEIIKTFNNAWSREGSELEKNSFVDYNEFIISLLGQLSFPKEFLVGEKIKALNEIILLIKE